MGSNQFGAFLPEPEPKLLRRDVCHTVLHFRVQPRLFTDSYSRAVNARAITPTAPSPWSVSLGYQPLRVPWRSTSRTSATADRAWRGPDTASYAATFQVRIAAGLATPLVTWLVHMELLASDSEPDSADSESPSKFEIGAA
jgi:hypothetical protein